jgi:hypothetical protein
VEGSREMTGRDDGADGPGGPVLEWIEKSVARRRIFTGFLFFILARLTVWFALPKLYGPTEAGRLGDAFGLLNSLIGGFTLFGVDYAAYLEHHQLELAREEARESGKERGRSLGLQLATAELNTLVALANAYSDDLSYLRAEGDPGDPTTAFKMKRAAGLRERMLIESRTILLDIRTPDFDRKSVPAERKTRTLKHVLQRFRDALIRFKTVRESNAADEDVRFLLNELSNYTAIIS